MKLARIKGLPADQPLKIPVEGNEIPKQRILHSIRPGYRHNTPAPIDTESSEFPEQLAEVVDTVRRVRLKEWPTEYLGTDEVPEYLRRKIALDMDHYGLDNPALACAMLVSMDKLTDFGQLMWDELIADGAEPVAQTEYGNPFVEGYAAFLADLGVRNHAALDRMFDIKAYWGKERPETVLGLPGCVFCLNDDGCPPHFAYGAGHGAVVGASKAVLKKHLNTYGHHDAKLGQAGFVFAHSRTLLGVHYREDNDLGIAEGENVYSYS